MKKNLIIVVSVIILIIVIFYLTMNSKSTSYSSTSNMTSIPTSEVSSPNSVSIKNFSFNPETLTIKAGETVTWTNNDSAVHNIKFDSFISPSINIGESYKHTFNAPGTFNYSCGIHPTMTGTIIVN